MYLCIVVTKDDFIKMIKVLYCNGSFVRAEKESSKDVEQVGNVVITATNKGWPFRGMPEDLARDALDHLSKSNPSCTGLFPVILDSKSGTDNYGHYTDEVLFQTVD